MDTMSRAALRAQQEDAALEELIRTQEPFILRCACAAARRPVTRSDDEWSVALAAFLEAVRAYRPERGDFPPFAQLVIRRRLADHFRQQQRFDAELPASPDIFESGPLEESPQPALQAAVISRLTAEQEDGLALEIDALSRELEPLGISFLSLASCSPKASKTRAACAKAVAFLVRNPVLLSGMRGSGQLPMKEIEQHTGVPRKILDRHRRYLIAAAVILSGEYPGLAAYLGPIREELSRR